MEADHIVDDADPVFHEDPEVGADQCAVGLLVVGIIKSCRRLVAVEFAGDDVGADDQAAVFIEGQMLVVNIDLRVGVSKRKEQAKGASIVPGTRPSR